MSRRDDAARRTALVALIVATVIALAWTLWPDAKKADPVAKPTPVPAAQDIVAGTTLRPNVCGNPAQKPFVPKQISIAGVADHANVLALPRDGNNVPQAPPLSNVGKTEFAWDAPTIKPGERKGNALFNAHTWPDGSAMGNHLLANLHVGDRIVVFGKWETLCYKVTKRTVIVASQGSYEYYVQDGPPQLALIVCSPPRLGPGNWYHRTIWYASPMYGDSEPAT
ncbi:class F sortase [Nocardioides marmorisolisilvae]|nr:class F sortase [Nocardioides marmorisolisilvae]